MDAWHRVGRIVRFSNLGTLIFFLLNLELLLMVFCPSGVTWDTGLPLCIGYFLSVIVSLSPVGEWVLAALAGARNIERKDIKIRLIPLLEVTFERAKQRVPSMVSSVNLKIVHDPAPNAFAIGRKTICVTDGLLNLSDSDIMAIFAHELGHLAYKHSTIQLLIGGGNLFIAGFLLILKVTCWIITGTITILALETKRISSAVLVGLIASISSISIWVWTKFCMLFLMWSMRQNEFVADEFAFNLGFGNDLARVLDNEMCSRPENGFLKALYSSHPHTDDRIAKLQELGVTYSRY